MDGAVGKRCGERGVDELVLLDQRQAVEPLGGDGDLEVVAAAGAILDRDIPSGEGLIEKGEDRRLQPSAMMLTMAGRIAFLLSVPERAVRSVFALVGGGVHETAEVVLPRLVRRSRLYEATAKNLLRVAIEVVGGVEAPAAAADEYEPNATKLMVRKGAGNVVELGSIAAFGFSPLWLLAAGADVTNGTRDVPRRVRPGAEDRGRARRGGAPPLGRRSPRRARGWHRERLRA